MKNQQATLEQVKRVLMTRVINYAIKKISHFYEKETSGRYLAWTMFNYFLIATGYESIVAISVLSYTSEHLTTSRYPYVLSLYM